MYISIQNNKFDVVVVNHTFFFIPHYFSSVACDDRIDVCPGNNLQTFYASEGPEVDGKNQRDSGNSTFLH